MKDLNALKYFIGIEVFRSKHRIFLSQWKYVMDFLIETINLVYEPTNTLIEVNNDLTIYSDQVPTNKEKYHRLVKN